MASDIVIGPVFGNVGEAPDWGLSLSSSVLAGGVDFDVTSETDPRRCQHVLDGVQCGGYQSGDDGLCAGHRKAKRAGTI